MNTPQAKAIGAEALAVPLVAFTLAALCLALTVFTIPTDALDTFAKWALFVGSFALLLRLGRKSWSGILAACLAVTFNPFKPIPFFNTETAVNIISAIAFGVIGWLALRGNTRPAEVPTQSE